MPSETQNLPHYFASSIQTPSSKKLYLAVALSLKEGLTILQYFFFFCESKDG
jgi:hypothetical protein